LAQLRAEVLQRCGATVKPEQYRWRAWSRKTTEAGDKSVIVPGW